MRKSCVALSLCLLLGGVAGAKDLWPPPWDASLPNQTTQGWEAMPTSGLEEVPPTWAQNPYLPSPFMTITNGNLEMVEGPDGPEVWTWHIGEGGGTVSIWVPNNPDPNLYKQIFWQMTSDKSPTPTGSPPTTNPPGTALPAPNPHIQHGGTWYTYNGLLEIRPNPEGEWINFDLVESTNIEEIVIKTVCVPEPASIALLAMGGLALIRRRRAR